MLVACNSLCHPMAMSMLSKSTVVVLQQRALPVRSTHAERASAAFVASTCSWQAISRIGATRSNEHDAHKLCGRSDAQNGSAKAIPRGAWAARRLRNLSTIAQSGLHCWRFWWVPRRCGGIRCSVKVPASLGGPLPLPRLKYTRRALQFNQKLVDTIRRLSTPPPKSKKKKT